MNMILQEISFAWWHVRPRLHLYLCSVRHKPQHTQYIKVLSSYIIALVYRHHELAWIAIVCGPYSYMS